METLSQFCQFIKNCIVFVEVANINVFGLSEWLVFNDKWAIFQLYKGMYKKPFRPNPFLFLLFNSTCLAIL